MTVEVECRAEAAPVAVEDVKTAAAEEVKCEKEELKPTIVEKSSSYREESNFLSDLKDHEKKALNELKSKLEAAILENSIFAKKESPKEETSEEKPSEETCEKKEESEVCEEETEKPAPEPVPVEKCDEPEAIDEDISIWGIPLLPSKGNESTNVVLLKFLRAREFKVNEAFEMLKKTLQWRKDFRADALLEEEFEAELGGAAYMSGVDGEGHPICYNIFGVVDEKTVATEEKRERFLRWRVQLMEKGVQKLDFKAGGVSSLLQINDLKNSPGASKKEVRAAVDKAVAVLQDNYPEFVAKNIFINVPFWYYAFHSLMSPFLTQRTRSKLVFARPSKVTETLLKYIPIQEIPVQYGGMKRENDFEFSNADGEATEVVIKAGATETIEIPTPEAGTTFIWDVTVLGWEVSYTEEFVPADENSYTMIVHKCKKMGTDEEAVRNTFKNNEAGKIVITVHNSSGKKKKLFYRYKIKKAAI
ncbi:patellin-4 [Salvia hispanica]|uniref:patellin-4 n=1 Tax=Salvia hispanica TaxID=49212 RepID=UPI002009D398|nr:patellin-4 [Salvia hispanica]